MTQAQYWPCRTRRFDLSKPLIMGILNVTPDSFSDGGQHNEPKQAIAWAMRMAQDGAATGAKLLLGLGGSLDVFAGVAQRAPEFYCKHNLEWFYRLIKNPSRAGRMMKLPLFLVHVAGEKRK